MKIAVLSDVHGNLPALQRVLEDIGDWQPERVIVNGDLLSRGPCSLAVLQALEAYHLPVTPLRGNHENFLLYLRDHPPSPASPTYEMDRFALWTVAQLGDELERVIRWDDHVDMEELEGGSLHITHGSRMGDRHGIHQEISDEELVGRLGDPRDLFVASHTHRPFTRRFEGRLIVNTGSVGQPFDGDTRACYIRLHFTAGSWREEVVRVSYDRERAARDFYDSGFIEGAGPFGELIMQEFKQARVLVGPWRARYLERIRAGAISVTDALSEYRNDIGL